MSPLHPTHGVIDTMLQNDLSQLVFRADEMEAGVSRLPSHPNRHHATYAVEAVSPPRPVQFVWKNSPLLLSTLSYRWAPK